MTLYALLKLLVLLNLMLPNEHDFTWIQNNCDQMDKFYDEQIGRGNIYLGEYEWTDNYKAHYYKSLWQRNI